MKGRPHSLFEDYLCQMFYSVGVPSYISCSRRYRVYMNSHRTFTVINYYEHIIFYPGETIE